MTIRLMTMNRLPKKGVGYDADNSELVAEYAPDFTDALVVCAGTNTEDGFVMAKNIGAGIVGDTMFVELGVDNVIGIRPEFCMQRSERFLLAAQGQGMPQRLRDAQRSRKHIPIASRHHREAEMGQGQSPCNFCRCPV